MNVRSSLVLTGSLLTCLQLLQVVVTDLHVAVVVAQTSGEVSSINVAGSSTLLLLGLDGLLLDSLLLLLVNLLGRGGTTKHTSDTGTNGVTNGRTNSNTGSGGGHLCKHTWLLRLLLNWLRVGGWLVWRSLVLWNSSRVSRSALSWCRAGNGWTGTTCSSSHCEYELLSCR